MPRALTCVCCLPGVALAQPEPAAGPGTYDAIVVTAAPGDRNRLSASISVSQLDAGRVVDLAPRSEAEVLRLIPGIRAEATAGPGGNANISVRGLPIASGGAKYVQLQEDGLPVIEYGDIAFGNNDYWLRYDGSVERIEAVRGGSAATFASQAPGAVINYISRTGERREGRVRLSTGLDHSEQRLDFAYGAPLGGGWRFHAGGFYRRGDGARDMPFRAMEGYQLKANVTRDFGNGRGYARLFLKRLDDRAPTYTHMPFGVRIKGSKVVDYYPLPGFDAREQTNHSTLNLRFPTVERDGSVKVTDANREGIHVKATSLGGQVHYTPDEALTIDERFHVTRQHGRFSAPFYGASIRVGDLVGSAVSGRTIGAVRYANGPLAGQAAPADLPVNRFPSLYTDMGAMDHFANDLALAARLPLGNGEASARAGWYRSRQRITMDWHWNTDFSQGIGANPAMLDLFDTTGAPITENGIAGYNRAFGGCCARAYDLTYTADAFYGRLGLRSGPLDLDASVRREHVRARGRFSGRDAAAPVTLDVNGDGAISLPETYVYLPSATPQPIRYGLRYTSWSLGGTWALGADASLFARASKGWRANADRIVSDFPGAFTPDGGLSAIGRAVALNPVRQEELGLRARGSLPGGAYGVSLTLFRARATEYNYDVTTQRQTFQNYRSHGLELEGELTSGPVSLAGWLVYTHARIGRDLIGNDSGNTPRATPELMYMLQPAVALGPARLGVTLLGQSSTYTDDGNALRQRGYATLGAFATARIGHGLELGLHASNLLNQWDQAGRLDQASVGQLAATGAVFGVPYAATNRVGPGRTVSASLALNF